MAAGVEAGTGLAFAGAGLEAGAAAAFPCADEADAAAGFCDFTVLWERLPR